MSPLDGAPRTPPPWAWPPPAPRGPGWTRRSRCSSEALAVTAVAGCGGQVSESPGLGEKPVEGWMAIKELRLISGRPLCGAGKVASARGAALGRHVRVIEPACLLAVKVDRGRLWPWPGDNDGPGHPFLAGAPPAPGPYPAPPVGRPVGSPASASPGRPAQILRRGHTRDAHRHVGALRAPPRIQIPGDL